MVTFDRHPAEVVRPDSAPCRLTSLDQKLELLAATGLDLVFVITFDEARASETAEEFVKEVLVDGLAAKAVVVGHDFHFGKNRGGNVEMLQHEGAVHGFDVLGMRLVNAGADAVSSTRIRSLLREGQVAEAAALLGRPHEVRGTVMHGDARGRELGFPTANIASATGFDLAQGVYAVRGLVRGRLVDGVASYGKPMFDNQRPPFETHFFDFDQDIYGEHISVALIGHIRGQKLFSGLDELIAAIAADSESAREVLGQSRPLSELDRKLGFFPA